VVISGNFRPGALQSWAETEVILRERLVQDMQRPGALHLLRREEDGADKLPENQQFELLVAEQTTAAEKEMSAENLMMFALTLAVAVFCTSLLGSYSPLQQMGAIVEPGTSLPVALLVGLVLTSELAKSAAAKLNGIALGPRSFLPSPQLGMLGVFAVPTEPVATRSAALAVALAGPLALAACSVLSLFAGHVMPDSFGAEVQLHPALLASTAWPLASLPSHCSAATWAGAQGLLMASLALLPQSPDGKVAWSCLAGRSKGSKLGDACAYIYPTFGLAAMWCFGPGFMAIPMTWSLLLVNASPREPPPALEEATEVPAAARLASGLVLAMASVAALPLPLNLLWGVH
ncbi:unnamed protein product, partial [Polarella glacialis]